MTQLTVLLLCVLTAVCARGQSVQQCRFELALLYLRQRLRRVDAGRRVVNTSSWLQRQPTALRNCIYSKLAFTVCLVSSYQTLWSQPRDPVLTFTPTRIGQTAEAQRWGFCRPHAGQVSFLSMVLRGPNASEFAIRSNECVGKTLKQGASTCPSNSDCDIWVEFRPATQGLREAWIDTTQRVCDISGLVCTTYYFSYSFSGFGVCAPLPGQLPIERPVRLPPCSVNPLTWGNKWSESFTDGSKLEVNCELPPDSSFGLPAYVYWYTNSAKKRHRVGQCLFSGGCNEIRYYTPGITDSSGKEACVISTFFQNVDGGLNDNQRKTADGTVFTAPDGPKPLVDVLTFTFDANDNKLSWINDKYEYLRTPQFASSCATFESHIGTFSRRAVDIDPVIGPQTEGWFDELASQLQYEPPQAMESFAACDLTRDGKCDALDAGRFQIHLGKCKSRSDYTLAVGRMDFDGDGCITLRDYQRWYLLFVQK